MEAQMIAIGADHGGFALKQQIIEYLDKNNIEYQDFGVFSEEKSDYPVVAKEVAKFVACQKFQKGLLFCGTGLGMCIAANKVKNVRAVCVSDCFSVKHSRLHNNANILCLGGRVVGPGLAVQLVDIFLNTEFEAGRHQKRLDMLETDS